MFKQLILLDYNIAITALLEYNYSKISAVSLIKVLQIMIIRCSKFASISFTNVTISMFQLFIDFNGTKSSG